MARQNITFAIFDVRPVDPGTKRVDFDFINNLEPTVDLRSYKKDKILTVRSIISKPIKKIPLKLTKSGLDSKEVILKELETTLAKKLNFKKEVKLFGGRLVDYRSSLSSKGGDEYDNLSRFRDEFSKLIPSSKSPSLKTDQFKSIPPPFSLPWAEEPKSDSEQADHQELVNLSPIARDLDLILTNFRLDRPSHRSEVQAEVQGNETETIADFAPALAANLNYQIQEAKAGKSLVYFASFLAAVFVLTFLSVKSFDLKDNIFNRSSQTYLNLALVQENISELEFFKAASSFALAAENLELMHGDFKKVSSVLRVLDKITFGGTSDVSNLIKAGELISKAGLDLAKALDEISQVNLITIIQPGSESNILEVLNQFRLDLIQASRNLNQAKGLLADSDSSIVPESEKRKIDEFRVKLPEFSDFIEKAVGYSDAIMVMLGQSNPQKYVLLFQNTSELRPTGGFPGSYALVEFDKGVMKQFAVDDIYNPDGQMKERIIPPRPLQRITPNWGMRDANWFIDFRDSAQKVAEFYYKDTGILADGIIAVNVDLIPEILKITGPIEMPDFGITLDSENFIIEIQKEVEYERSKGGGKPKQILVEFAPLLLEKVSSLDKEGWMKIFALFVEGTEKKNILAYFVDRELENFALENGFAGEIKNPPAGGDSDYLMIVHSNIMGSKTDAVIDNTINLNIENLDGELIHTLEVKRSHQGGDLGFYNKANNDYIRILLPEDAELVEISGNDGYEAVSLADYSSQGFSSDPDLERYESSIKMINGIETFNEGNKKVFAFWMIVRPGQEKTVVIKYKTPQYKDIYIQKQPGLKNNFRLDFGGKNIFDENISSDKNITLE